MEGYIGEIRMFAGLFAPTGWQFCLGQQMQINANQALYAIIGTTYGGDGRSTFNLPNLGGRFPMGTSATVPVAKSGGVATVAIQQTNLPTISVPLQATTTLGDTSVPTAGAMLASTVDTSLGGNPNIYLKAPSSADQKVTLSMGTLPGGSTPLNVQNPYLGINFIICVNGIFPDRP